MIQWVSIAKGIGIVFVVFCHYLPDYSPSYWREIRQIITAFNMPLFFILSGFLYDETKYSYKDLTKKKFTRLIVPFISIAIIILCIKLIAARFVNLKFPVSLQSVITLFIDPFHSYAPLLWFIYVLFFIFLIYPLFRMLTLDHWMILFLFIALNLFFLNPHRIIYFLPFFCLGALFRTFHIKITTPQICFLVICFAISYSLLPDAYIFKFITGATGALVVIGISQTFSLSIVSKIGTYSMTIYLFHTIFESTVRIILNDIAKSSSIAFIAVALCAISVGVYFPIILEKYFICTPKIRKIIFGIF